MQISSPLSVHENWFNALFDSVLLDTKTFLSQPGFKPRVGLRRRPLSLTKSFYFFQSSGIGPLVEPMVWVYVEDVDRFVDASIWTTFGIAFDNIWTASAFKGAFGERLFSVNVQRHAANQVFKSGNLRSLFRSFLVSQHPNNFCIK